MKKVIIIDSHAILHRTFHALPPLLNKEGKPTGAIYGFLLLFLRLLKEFKPDFIIAAFDYPAPTFRYKKYKQYKAQRKKGPPELYDQINETKKMLQVLKIKIYEKKGFEADDIIATLVKLCSAKKLETIIISGDLDVLQLVNKKTKAYILKTGIKQAVLYDEQEVEKKYHGLGPKQLVDFRALRGDASDNIPGVPGIGEKTAIKLLKKYGSLENVLKKEPLKKDIALLSKELAKLKNNVIINFDLTKCSEVLLKKEKLIKLLEQKGFDSLVKRLNNTENLKLF
ncbi:MAG: 5'-3' exonuclease H3TH domain-containing protein [Candidatus Pacebacteria bacterium]|nr:5'-3' exonuclease H3TH domain-containing protein [Candidatus Paceibacterota bacterium]